VDDHNDIGRRSKPRQARPLPRDTHQ